MSEGAGADLRAFLGARVGVVHVIPNPVIMPDLVDRAQAGAPHRWLEKAGPPVLIGVGRLGTRRTSPRSSEPSTTLACSTRRGC
ncbi:MAG: hypothetical protein U5K74_01460 [Gemmatimonadaceae bacterium]|nr:hypothetical protein [Gemmatimonadaceae bacterium]